MAIDAAGKALRKDKLTAFLIEELARKELRQCVGIALFYSPGADFRDEEIRAWSRDEDPRVFEDCSAVEPLVDAIFQATEDELAYKETGKHRFYVRTHQYLGIKPTFSFSLHYASTNDEAGQTPHTRKSQYPRRCLLVRVAGDVASGLVQRSPPMASDAVVTASIDIAEALLKKAGV